MFMGGTITELELFSRVTKGRFTVLLVTLTHIAKVKRAVFRFIFCYFGPMWIYGSSSKKIQVTPTFLAFFQLLWDQRRPWDSNFCWIEFFYTWSWDKSSLNLLC